MKDRVDILTLQWLLLRKPDTDLIRSFKKNFGTVAFIEHVVEFLHKFKREDWEGWLLVQSPGLTTALLVKGANVHVLNGYALRWAAFHGYDMIVEILVANGADVHVDNNFALRMAAMKGHTKTVEILIANGADVHVNNNSPLHLAAVNGHVHAAKALRQATVY